MGHPKPECADPEAIGGKGVLQKEMHPGQCAGDETRRDAGTSATRHLDQRVRGAQVPVVDSWHVGPASATSGNSSLLEASMLKSCRSIVSRILQLAARRLATTECVMARIAPPSIQYGPHIGIYRSLGDLVLRGMAERPKARSLSGSNVTTLLLLPILHSVVS